MRRVTAAVIVESGRLFLVRRGPAESLAGCWELPGGKVEPDETIPDCLMRELREELAMTAEVGSELARTAYHYEHGSFEMIALETTRTSEFQLSVHDAHMWASRADLASIRLAPADVELITQVIETGHWS
jgi:8-oxo-dGTP diphosphatase